MLTAAGLRRRKAAQDGIILFSFCGGEKTETRGKV